MSAPIPIPVQEDSPENPRAMLSRQLSRSSELPRMLSGTVNPYPPSPTTQLRDSGSRMAAKVTRTEQGSALKSRAKKRRKSESVAFASLRSALSPRKSKKSIYSPDISTAALDVDFLPPVPPRRPRGKLFSCYFPVDRDTELDQFLEMNSSYDTKELPPLPPGKLPKNEAPVPKPRRNSSGNLQRLTPQLPSFRPRSPSKTRRSPREGDRDKIERRALSLLQFIETERPATPTVEERSPSYEELLLKVQEQEETINAMEQNNQEAKFGEIVKLRTQVETLKQVHSSTLDRVELLKQALMKVKQEYEKSQVVIKQLTEQLAEEQKRNSAM